MIFEVGVNTYMTLEEANQIVSDNFDETEDAYVLWSKLTPNEKKRLIVKNTKLVDTLIWRGCRYPGYDRMAWPRLITFRYTECPYDVKVGILTQGLTSKIYASDASNEQALIAAGVEMYKSSKVQVRFNTNKIPYTKLNNGIYTDIFKMYFEKYTI